MHIKVFQTRDIRRHTIIGLAVTLAVCIFLSVASYFFVILPFIDATGYPTTEEGKEKLLSTPLLEDSTVQQNFFSEEAFRGVSFRLNFSKNLPEEAGFFLKLFNSEGGELFSKEFLFANETSDKFINLLFDQEFPGGGYQLEISSFGINEGLEPDEEQNQFYAWFAKDVECATELATVNLFSQKGNLDFFLASTYEFLIWPFVLGCIFLTVAACCCIIFRFVPLEWFYCFLGGVIGIVLLVVQCPMYGFDTRFHADTSYLLSNQMLGIGATTYQFQDLPQDVPLGAAEQSLWEEIEKDTAKLEQEKDAISAKEYAVREKALEERKELCQEGNYYLRRSCDDLSEKYFPRTDSEHSKLIESFAGPIQNGYFLQEDDSGKTESTDLVAQKIYDGTDGTTTYLYLPQAFGFTVARLLGMNANGMLLLGRLFNFLVYLFFTAAAIRCAPFAKSLFLLVAILPTSLQLGATLSRDALVVALSFFCIAKILQFSYCKEHISWFHTLPFIAAAILLAPAKAVYFPVSFLCFFVLIRRYAFPKGFSYKKISKKHLVFFVIGLLLVIAVFAAIAWPSIASRLSATETPSVNLTLGKDDPGSFTFLYCLAHPLEAISLIFRTFYNGLGEILLNAVVPFELNLGYSQGVLFGWLLCLILCVCQAPHYGISASKADRRIFLIAFSFVFLLLTGAAILWTPLDNISIWGLQGRYLTPVLPLLMLFFANRKWIGLRKNPTRGLCMAALALSYFTLMDNYLWLFDSTISN